MKKQDKELSSIKRREQRCQPEKNLSNGLKFFHTAGEALSEQTGHCQESGILY